MGIIDQGDAKAILVCSGFVIIMIQKVVLLAVLIVAIKSIQEPKRFFCKQRLHNASQKNLQKIIAKSLKQKGVKIKESVRNALSKSKTTDLGDHDLSLSTTSTQAIKTTTEWDTAQPLLPTQETYWDQAKFLAPVS